MIKTVSFAPPRSTRAAAKTADKSSSKTAKAQLARADEAVPVASKSAKMQPARAMSGSSPISKVLTEAPSPRPRPAASKSEVAPSVAEATPKTTEVKKPRAIKNAPAPEVAAPAIVAPTAKTPAKRAARKAAPNAATLADVETKSMELSAPQAAMSTAATAPTAPLKVKRSRAPKDLALQYGAAPETEQAPRVAEKSAPRKRLTRAAKEARSQMLRPDDDVLQRLKQANAVEVQKPARRGRGWEFECGRCGRISHFQTSGAICECGAIAVRE